MCFFFHSISVILLHLMVKLRKPGCPLENSLNVISSTNALTMLQKKITWSNAAMCHPENAFFLCIPATVKRELYKAVIKCFDRGMSVDDLDCACNFPAESFSLLKSFAVSVRNSLLRETGLILLKGLNLDVFGFGGDSEEKMVMCSKIAYYLICSHIGAVDGSARGRFFDVENHHINVMDVEVDNVLLSVSDCQCVCPPRVILS